LKIDVALADHDHTERPAVAVRAANYYPNSLSVNEIAEVLLRPSTERLALLRCVDPPKPNFHLVVPAQNGYRVSVTDGHYQAVEVGSGRHADDVADMVTRSESAKSVVAINLMIGRTEPIKENK
jgi:hypothetical protein